MCWYGVGAVIRESIEYARALPVEHFKFIWGGGETWTFGGETYPGLPPSDKTLTLVPWLLCAHACTCSRENFILYSELPLIRTPEMWPPLYSGHSEKSQSMLYSTHSPLK